MACPNLSLKLMHFRKPLAATRKERGFTQQQIADKIGLHVSQLDTKEKAVIMELIDGILLKHDAKRWMQAR